MDKKTLTVRELSEVLNIGRSTAYEALRSGQIPSVKVGRRWLIPIAALDQLLNVEMPTGVVSQPFLGSKKSQPYDSD